MALPLHAELLGSSAAPISVTGTGVLTSVQLTATGQRWLAGAAGPVGPGRVFLALENVRGTRDATVLNAYLVVPAHNPADAPSQLLVGGEALYGLRRASTPQGHNREGLTLVFDITPLLPKLGTHQARPELWVRIAPERPLPVPPDITVGRVSVFRTPPN